MKDTQNHNNNINFTYNSQIYPKQSIKLPQFVKSCFLRRSASQNQMEKFDLQNIIVRSTFTGAICNLCQVRFRIQQMVVSHQNCCHSFCQQCIHNYLVYKIDARQEIACPQQNCHQIIDSKNICFQNLTDNYKNKYEQFQLWKQTLNNPNLRLCPIEKCKGMINKQKSFTCNICKTQFCRQCMFKKHDGPCDDNFQKNFKEWKRCPKCNIFIQKTQGCNHMTCRCSHQFCYVCLAAWSEQHYQCGQNGVNRVFRQLLLPEDQLTDLPRSKQILFGILLIIFLPVAAAILLAGFLICIVGGPVIAVIISPCAVLSTPPSQQCCQMCCPCWCVIFIILIPIIMLVAAVASFFVIAFNVGIAVIFVFWAYLQTAIFLLCNNQEEEGNGGLEIEQQL